VLFVTERLPIDVTSILLLVLLVVLEPWVGIDPSTGISGFANEATIASVGDDRSAAAALWQRVGGLTVPEPV